MASLHMLLAQTLSVLLPILVLCVLPFRRRLRCSVFHLVIIASVSVVAVLVAARLSWRPSINQGAWKLGYPLLFLFFYMALYPLVVKAPLTQLLFTGILVKNYSDTQAFLASYMMQILLDDHIVPSWLSYLTAQMLALTLTLPLISLFLVKLLEPLVEEEEQRPYWRFLWIIPAIFYLIYRLGINPEFLMASQVHLSSLWLPPLWAAGTFLCYGLILRMLSDTTKTADLQEKLHTAQVQMQMQQAQYEKIQKNMQEAQRQRHDLRHRLLALQGYAYDPERLRAYLGEWMEVFDSQETTAFCGNLAVDAVARHYVDAARAAGVDIGVTLSLPAKLPVLESDLCIVLGNLMENAVEACLRQNQDRRYIRLKADTLDNGMLTLVIRNSFNGKVMHKGDVYLSCKRPSVGIGLSSVQAIAERYRGVVRIQAQGEEFQVSVLLCPL